MYYEINKYFPSLYPKLTNNKIKMIKKIVFSLSVIFAIGSCTTPSETTVEIKETNPFMSEYKTPFGVPPFDRIKSEHFVPAFQLGMKQQNTEIKKIIDNTDDPTFENTIEAIEKSNVLLTNVSNVFYNYSGAITNDEIQKIAKEIAPVIAQHSDNIKLNAKLFAKIKVVYDKKDELNLSSEKNTLLEKTYKIFVRGGANISLDQQNRLRDINKELSVLSLKFGENVLNETNKFKLIIDNNEDLAGLPKSIIDAASEVAVASGDSGKWIFTIHKPSLIPFLQYSEKRELREKIFKAYINKGNHNDELDNKAIVSKLALLRIERANLLGYSCHADYILEENMSVKPENVFKLLDQLMKSAIKVAKQESIELQNLIDKEGGNFKLEAWDWWYYTEKLRKEKFDLDEEILRPYFKLENVRDGAFALANKLYGIQFNEVIDIPKYHEDVKAYEVKEADGSHIGILYMDFFPRKSKRGGAWMSSYRKQSIKDGKKIHPVIVNVCNFSKPTAGKPALLSFEEVTTLFHEFGHGLHGLLSNCEYNSLSGTSVARDFVELPSQIMENWASEPELLKIYAKHYETGEIIPQEIIDKIKESSKFNQGFITTEYLAAALLDMSWHTMKEKSEIDVNKFEEETLTNLGLMPEIVVRYRSTYFNHIFSGGYSSGYYSYIWSAILDADAFSSFKETGLFDKNIAESFRRNILERGGSEKPMALYKKFRGAEPKIDALLKRKGFI